eukprot:jgi/Tetstr1/447224/TSEL_034661.t1
MEGDGRSPDDEEDEDAGAELRVVKRCLRKALNMSTDEKDLFVSRVEELVVAVSRLMHHGSLLATNYVLHRMNDGNPPSDDLLTDQTFYRQCMTYSSSSVRSGAYPEVKSFADTKRHLIPHTEQVPYSGNCVNAAARKLKSSVLTILSHRFHQRVTSARRQMVTLDADTLVGLCKAVGILPSGAGRKALTEDFKRSLLRVPAGFVFSDKTSLESDGVAIVLRTSKTNPLASAEMATKDDLEDIVFDRVLANDPGRADIATVVEWTDEEGLKRGSTRLTRKEYYQQAGINRRARKRRMRDRAISEHLNKWKEASIKTADPEAFEEALRVRMSPLPGSEGDPSIEVVWGHQLARWTSIMDMTAFAAKRRTLDRFWRHKVGLEARHDLSRTVVVFGDGKFSASGRGERAVPRKAMEASAARFAAKVVKEKPNPHGCVVRVDGGTVALQGKPPG